MKDIPETREDLVRGYRFDMIMDILLIFLGVIMIGMQQNVIIDSG